MSKRFNPVVAVLLILGIGAGLGIKWYLDRDATLPPIRDKDLLALANNGLKNSELPPIRAAAWRGPEPTSTTPTSRPSSL